MSPRPRQTLDQPFSLRLTPADVEWVKNLQALMVQAEPEMESVLTLRQVMRVALRTGLAAEIKKRSLPDTIPRSSLLEGEAHLPRDPKHEL